MSAVGYFLSGVCVTLGVELLICLVVGWRMTRPGSKETVHQDWQAVRDSIRRRAEKVQQN